MKPLIFLGALAAFGAAALAYMTRAKLIEAREMKDDLNRETVKIHSQSRTVNDSTNEVHTQFGETKKNAEDEVEAAVKAKKDEAAQEEALAAANDTVKQITDKRETMNAEIKAILGGNGTPEEVLAKVEAAKGEIDTRTKELETLTGEMEIAKKELAKDETQSTRLKEAQVMRSKAIALGGRSGTVAAVNPDWAFCVINMGQNQGVNMNSRLIVKRGTQLVGKLNIVQINANQTVADIDPKGFGARGSDIQPGDEVVFENTAG
jgi:hypothetical protein